MAAYKQISTWWEDGHAEMIRDIVVVADSYEALADLDAAIDVNVLEWESTKRDLDANTGAALADEFTFSVLEPSVMLEEDALCVDFILAASDPDVIRYVARFINPADPIGPIDYEFRGRIRSELSAEDEQWNGTEYTSDPLPTRVWKLSAGTFEAAHILDAKLSDVRDLITSAWRDEHVADRLGYFKTAAGAGNDPNAREVRWGNLMSLQDFIQKLLDITVAPYGLTATFLSTPTDLVVIPARFVPTQYNTRIYSGSGLTTTYEDVTVQARYTNRIVGASPQPYTILSDDLYTLIAGGADTHVGSLWVSSRCFWPLPEEEAYSWLHYDTVAELLYALAASLGMFVRFEYTTAVTLSCWFEKRSAVEIEEIFIRDAIDAAIDLSALSTGVDDDEPPVWAAPAWQVTDEGPAIQYNYNGSSYYLPEARAVDRAPEKGDRLPLSISPCWCLLENRGRDARQNIGSRYGYAILPHNAVLWDHIEGAWQRKQPEDTAENSRLALHTGMYVRVPGRNDDGSIGVTGMPVWAPVAAAWTRINGQLHGYTRLADYVNHLTQRDGTYFRSEYEITVPGLMAFKLDPTDAAGNWRHCRLGNVITLDDAQYIVVGIERGATTTKLRLQAKSRFAFTMGSTTGILTGSPGPGGVLMNVSQSSAAPREQFQGTFVVSTEIGTVTVPPYCLVRRNDDGSVQPARAHHADYGRIIGVSLDTAAPGEEVRVQTFGTRLQIPVLEEEGYDFAPGQRVYLRTLEASPAPQRNIRPVALDGVTSTEDFFFDAGVAEDADTVLLEPGPCFVWQPPLP